MNWKPPKSPYTLLQEQIYDDPWKVFVCCIFCNLTRRLTAEPIFWQVIKRWPDAQSLSKANINDLIEMIKDLGLSQRRAKALIKMSDDYINKDWKADPAQLYGVGKYASDAYRIFCRGDWRDVEPKDGALVNYRNYLKEFYDAEENKKAC